MLELLNPDLHGNGIKSTNSLRWEEDGGRTFETVNLLPQLAEKDIPRLVDVA